MPKFNIDYVTYYLKIEDGEYFEITHVFHQNDKYVIFTDGGHCVEVIDPKKELDLCSDEEYNELMRESNGGSHY